MFPQYAASAPISDAGMVIDDIDIVCVFFRPPKTDPPSVVDADTMPAFAIADRAMILVK